MTVTFRIREMPTSSVLSSREPPKSIISICSTKLNPLNQPANFEGYGYVDQNYLERVIINNIIGGSAEDAKHPENANTGLKSFYCLPRLRHIHI